MAQQFKRAPARFVRIADIDPATMIRVRLIGRVLGATDGTIVLDDGSGKADIVIDEQGAETNALVRVFARVLPLESGYELRAEIIQPLERPELFQQTFGKSLIKNE